MQVVTFHFDRQNAAIAGDPIRRNGVLYQDTEGTTPVNVTGWTCVFTLINPAGTELLRLTTENSGVVLGTSNGAWSLDSGTASPAVSIPETPGTYTYALEFSDGDGVRQIAIRGNYIVLDDRTPTP